MQTVAKIAGWTIGAAVVAKLFTSSNFGTNVGNIFNSWANVLKGITGGSQT